MKFIFPCQTHFCQGLKTPVLMACGQASYGRNRLFTASRVRRTPGGTPLRRVFSIPGKRCPIGARIVFALIGVLSLPCGARQAPQDEVPLAPQRASSREAYRIRVENMLQGSIRVSTDGGLHYTLIGRVTRPAAAVQPDRSANLPGVVLRGSGDGIALAVNLGQVLKLRPEVANGAGGKRGGTTLAPEPGAIATNIAPRSGIFADLLPPSTAQVKLEVAPRVLRPFPTLYDPQQEEPIVIVVSRQDEETGNREPGTANPQLSTLNPQLIAQRVAALGQAYFAQSLAHAKQEHRPVVSGVLSLKAKLPEGEPDPISFVLYVVDNQIVSSQNVPPFQFEWDTRREAEGEHLVEVRALNRNSHVITTKRALLVVQNKLDKETGRQGDKESGNRETHEINENTK